MAASEFLHPWWCSQCNDWTGRRPRAAFTVWVQGKRQWRLCNDCLREWLNESDPSDDYELRKLWP